MFRPLVPVKVKISKTLDEVDFEKETDRSDSKKIPLLLRIKLARESLQADSMQNLDHEIEITAAEDVVDSNHHLKVSNNNKYPTAMDVLTSSTKNLQDMKESCHSLYDSNHYLKSVSASERKLNIMELKPDSRNQNGLSKPRARAMSSCSTRSRRNTGASGVRPLYRDDIFFGASLTKLPHYSSQVSHENE